MDKFLVRVIICIILTIVGLAIAVNWSINRQQEIIVEKTIIVISSGTAQDMIFNYNYTKISLFATGEHSDYLIIWGNHPEFEAWHKYRITYHKQFAYLQMYAELISVEELGAVPIPTE